MADFTWTPPMLTQRPILLVDDDNDDQYFFRRALQELTPVRPLLTFQHAQALLDHLASSPELPFLILSEVKLAGMNGLELRQAIEQDPMLKKRSIPFIFFSNPVPDYLVDQAYNNTIQGFFEKPNDYEALRACLKRIVDYWTDCIHPNR